MAEIQKVVCHKQDLLASALKENKSALQSTTVATMSGPQGLNEMA